jgi:hypothetical protein
VNVADALALEFRQRCTHDGGMSIKELALRTITDLAEDVSYAEIEDRIHFLAAIEKARQEVRRGEVVPHDDVRRMLEEDQGLRADGLVNVAGDLRATVL